MIIPIVVLAVSAVFFAIGRVRADVVALCALLALVLTNVLTPAEALAGFASPVVVMMAGLFVVGGAVLQTGLAKMMSGRIMALAGQSSGSIYLLVMLVTAVIGAFVSNTGTVALMLPIVVSIAASARTNVRTLLMPLAFASSMGGMLTLIGTPPNLVIDEALIEAGHEGLSFFSFLPVGVVCIIVGVLVLWPLSKYFLSKRDEAEETSRGRKSLNDLVGEYGLDIELTRCQLDTTSRLVGMKMADVDLYNQYGLTILERRQERMAQTRLMKNVSQTTVDANTVFETGDVLYLSGGRDRLKTFFADYQLNELKVADKDESSETQLEFYDIGLAELVMLQGSRLVGRRIRSTALRAKYHINVLTIRRKGKYIREELADEVLSVGDVLLVQGNWSDIARLEREEDDWVVLGQPLAEAAQVTLTYRAPLAGAILLLMVAMMVFDFIPVAPVTAVLLAAVLMVLCGCFRNVEAAYKTINWESLVLIAAMMPMSVALEKTGASALLSHTLVDGLGVVGPVALLAGIYFTTSLLTLFISNTATAVLMAPIALSSAAEMGISPYAFLFAVTLGASMCFASPFSTPPNALVMQAGRYSFMDYIKVGIPLQVIMGLVMLIVLPLLFSF
uniref:SLC13 family permease n=1 Tax=Alloprevotella sp. TaxID=1872471 RepID=UPI0040290863